MTRRAGPGRDRAIAGRLSRWFRAHARDLPWREVGAGGRRDAYRALVSEFMLQQTQVSRVTPIYERFIRRFPTVERLARARESSVLAAWSGLGYYRRARHLHNAAKKVVRDFGGEVPSDPEALRSLPGVGRYTAGAVASLVFGRAEPIVDGNVARVLARLDGAGDDRTAAWDRAETLVRIAARTPGAGAASFNEGLMELGATVCTPRAPRCGVCPLAGVCAGREAFGSQRGAAPRTGVVRRGKPVLHVDALLVRDARGRLLVERRGDGGLWAGLWQPPTLERPGRAPAARSVRDWAGGPVVRAGAFEHVLSHRRVRFRVWRGELAPAESRGVFKTRGQIGRLALSSAHRRILLEMS
ncbi:MAG: A/G-specific adenine glycosylase [Planctomycetota bacterium]|nr:MAG: A/G-specific adenine glycosylase [Planctomycetota bacterium]